VSIDGRTVLITGAAGGIGAATARRLAAHGARLVLLDVEREALISLGAELGGRAIAIPCDVTQEAQLMAAVRNARDRFGTIDVVIANAALDAIAPVAEMPAAIFDRVIEVNLLGTYRTVRSALPALPTSDGYILIISSLGAVIPPPYQSAYAASKAGLAAFGDSLRLELRASGTRVGVLYFGAVDTEHFRRGMAHPLMQRANARIPKSFTRPAPVEDAAAAIERAVDRRARRAVFPRSNAPMLWAPKAFQRMAERWISS
jgi:NAD(P)-dependent dehydrogenase (short-subunit alcohol dehydrogenase family)